MKRSYANPIITRSDVPDLPPHVVDVSSVFNPGALRVGDRYVLLLRVQTRGRETVLMVAESEDGDQFSVRPHYWDELIGSGPPPVKTREGWLHVYHGVATHFASVNIYQAGVVLLDLADPRRILARGRNNIGSSGGSVPGVARRRTCWSHLRL